MKARTSSRTAASSPERLSSTTAPSPLFAERADFELERPGAARLLVELPVGLGYRLRRHQQVGVVERVGAERLDAALPDPFGIDAGIDDQMRDVDVLRPELARGCLRHSAQAELGAGEGRITRATAQARGGTSEEDVPLPTRQHQLGSFPARQKA